MDENTQSSPGDLKFEGRLFKSLKCSGLLFPMSKAELIDFEKNSADEGVGFELKTASLLRLTTEEFELGLAAFSSSSENLDLGESNTNGGVDNEEKEKDKQNKT